MDLSLHDGGPCEVAPTTKLYSVVARDGGFELGRDAIIIEI